MNGKQALVLGGTAGIGMGVALALAQQHCHVIIGGRSEAKGLGVIERMKELSPDSEFSFVKFDATLMTSVRDLCQQFKSHHRHLDYLVMSQGIMTTKNRTETVEGIDEKLAVHYYSRHVAIRQLLPELEKAAEINGDARVLSVLAATHGKPAPEQDYALEKHFSVYQASQVAPFHNDLMVDAFAARHPTVSFIHAFPGFVSTELGRDLPWYARAPMVLFSVLGTKPERVGESFRAALLNPAYAKGYHLINQNGAEYGSKTSQHTDELRDAVFEHSVKLTEAALEKSGSPAAAGPST